MARDSRHRAAIIVLALSLVACGRPNEQAALHAEQARAALAAGDFASARAEGLNALQISPKNVAARYVLARLAARDGDIGQMLGHLEIVVGEDPRHLEARVELARVLFFAEDYSGAARLVEQAERLAPDDPGVRLIRARLAINAGNSALARQDLDFVLARDPGLAEAALLRGTLYAIDEPARAVADLSAAIARADLDSGKALRRARLQLLRRLGVTELLEEELIALQADFPEESYAEDLARLYLADGRQGDAEQVLRAAVERVPDNANLCLALALFQKRIRLDASMADATIASCMSHAPDAPAGELLRGRYLEATGRPGEARRVYQRVVENPGRKSGALAARNRLAALALADDQPADARVLYEQVLGESPDDVEARLGRARVAIGEGRTEEALNDLRAAVRKAPDHEAALLLLARTHARAGQAELAERAWRRLLQVDPDQRVALGALGAPRSPGNPPEKSRMTL